MSIQAIQHKALIDQVTAQKTGPQPGEKPSDVHKVIPYIQGLGESFKKICRKYGIQTHLRGNSTIK